VLAAVWWKKTPEILEAIAAIMEHATAGDPFSGLKWTRKTTAKIAKQLKRIDIQVSANTVGRLLKQKNFSLCMKMFSFISNNWAAHPLLDYETVLKFIRTTKTSAGLNIRAFLNRKNIFQEEKNI
jgi:hypothetical protein